MVPVLTGGSGRAPDSWRAKLTIPKWRHPVRFERVHGGMLLLLNLLIEIIYNVGAQNLRVF